MTEVIEVSASRVNLAFEEEEDEEFEDEIDCRLLDEFYANDDGYRITDEELREKYGF